MALVLQQPTDFYARTAANSMFGLAGLVTASISGNKIVKDYHLVDPSVRLGNKLAIALSEKYQLTTKTVMRPVNVSGWGQLPAVAQDVDLLLSVRTSYWGVGYFPTNWARYKFHHHVEVNLTDRRNNSVLAQGDCLSDATGVDKSPPSYDQLLADDAAELKRQIADAVDMCLDEYESQLFLTAAARLPPRPKPSESPATQASPPPY